MGPRLTLGLVLMAAATLILGFMTHGAWLIYLSIGCSALAAAGLMTSSRRSRQRAEVDVEMAWTASLAEPSAAASPSRSIMVLPGAEDDLLERTLEPAVAGTGPPGRRSGPTRSGPSRTAPSPVVEPEQVPEQEPDEPWEPVIRGLPPRPRTPKRNPVVSDWVHRGPTQQPAAAAARPAAAAGALRQPASAPATRRPRPPEGPAVRRSAPYATRSAGPAARTGRRPLPVVPAEDYPFPIEDYDSLGVAEILPLLPELDDQEILEVLLYEQHGANRVAILNRIDALLEGDN